jgi:anti-anti-sigma factor
MNTNLDSVNGILTITIPGDLTSTTAEPLRPSIYGVLEKQGNARTWKIFRLELPAAKMVDSVGLNFIVSLLKTVQQNGGKMQIACANANVHRTFLFTRLDKQIELIKL